MTIKQLQYFTSFAKYKNLSVAAEKLYISQPALSSALQSFEKELGLELFQRNGRKLELTDVGLKVRNYAEVVLSAYYLFFEQVKSLSDTPVGTLKIGIPNSVSRYLLSNILCEFYKVYPEVKLTIVSDGAYSIQNKVLEGDLDCGFAMNPITSKLSSDLFVSDELVAVVPINHPLNRPEGIKIGDLKGQQLIMLGPSHSVYYEILQSCEKAGFAPQIIVTSSDVGLLINMVKNGVGISIQSKMIARATNNPDVALVSLDSGNHRWDISFIYPKNDIPLITDLFHKHIKHYSEEGKTAGFNSPRFPAIYKSSL